MNTKMIEDYSRCLKVVESYLYDNYRIEVYFDKDLDDAYYHNGPEIDEDDYITINSKRPKEWQLYALLHEAGHIMLREDTQAYLQRFPKVTHPTLIIAKRIDILREEVFAWENAQKLANMLDIKLNTPSFERQRTNALMKYVRWVENPKQF